MLVSNVSWILQEDGSYQSGLRVWMPSGDEPVFIPLKIGKELSWVFRGPRLCIGSIDENGHMIRCPEDSVLLRSGTRCGPCSAMDYMDPCIKCNGRNCTAPEGRRVQCDSTDYVVYMVLFNDRTMKIGVSTKRRYLTRWIEQGADFGGVLQEIKGGRQARLIENRIGRRQGATKMVSSTRKINGLMLQLDLDEAQNIARTFLDDLADPFVGTEVTLESLSGHYNLSDFERPPRPWKKRSEQVHERPLVGTIAGMKGSLLITHIGSEYTAADLRQTIGYTINPATDITVVTQTGLADFF